MTIPKRQVHHSGPRPFVEAGARRHTSAARGGYFILPVLAILVCGFIFYNLSHTAKVLGTVWTGCGFVYLAIVSRGFKRKFVLKDL